MSNKAFKDINILDQTIRKTLPPGMTDGTHLTIEYFTGFEIFNTRRYHNYETWAGGYRVTGEGITIEREDLDEAINAWVSAYLEALPNAGSPDLVKGYDAISNPNGKEGDKT